MSDEAIRVEAHVTYWTERPDGWTDEEWSETVKAAKEGRTFHEGIDEICRSEWQIELDIERAVYEPAAEEGAA